MASVKGFSLKEIALSSGSDGTPLRQANLYYKNQKVGFLCDDATGGMPLLEIDPDYQTEWEDAIAYFRETHYEANEIANSHELFYYLLTISEWEETLTYYFANGFAVVTVLEEVDKKTGYRTGGYKVFTFSSEDEVPLLVEPPTGNGKVVWRKSVFTSTDELNFM